MRKLFAYLISIYQSRISPHKGFSCAHKGLHKGVSCSEYVKHEILNKGIFASLATIRQRFNDCHDAAQTIQRSSLKHQRGDCDLGISDCDLGNSYDSCGSKKLEAIDCFSGCDFYSSDKKNRKRDLWIFIVIVILLLVCALYFFK